MNKTTMTTLMSSGDTTGSEEWETPRIFRTGLRKRYGKFTLDAAATAANSLADRYFTKKDNAFEQTGKAANVFINPPYGRGLRKWVQWTVQQVHAAVWKQAVMLLPSRTDVRWWHQCVMPFAREVLFVPGRIIFEENGKPRRTLSKKTGKWVITPAPFPSVIVQFVADPIWYGHAMYGAWPMEGKVPR